MNKHIGLRVYPGLLCAKNKLNSIGTIFKEVENIATISWDYGSENQYGIGKNNNYNLLLWDSGATGVLHDNCVCKGCSGNITGTKWGCLETTYYYCGKCYIKLSNEDHFYRLDYAEEIGSYVGMRNDLVKSKCYGIFRGSHVKATLMGLPVIGRVASFADSKSRYRSRVNVINSETKKIEKIEFKYLKLIKEKITENSVKDFYPNHLRVLFMHPIFNLEYRNIYHEELKSFKIKEVTENTDFNENDLVYVDCFDEQSLREFQNGYGESNEQIKKLIGKCGYVKSMKLHNASVHFESTNQVFNFNSRILFKSNNSVMKAIRIESEAQLIECISNWKKSVITEKIRDISWVPDENIIKMISNKIGVIIIPDLPGGLVGVRFKRFPDSFCMMLPKAAFRDIDPKESEAELVSLAEDIPDNIHEAYNAGLQYIKDGNFKDLNDWMFSEENHHNQSILWYHWLVYTIRNENIDMFKSLLALSVKSKDQILYEIISTMYINSSSGLDPAGAIVELIIQNLSPSRLSDLFHLATRAGNKPIVKFLMSNYKRFIKSFDEKSGYSALHFAVENEDLDIIRILMEHKCDMYVQENTNGFTPLHFALKHYYIKSFCMILELLDENLDTTKTDINGNTILHLSASFPDENHFKKWENIINGDIMQILEDAFVKHDSFKATHKSLTGFGFENMPFALLSHLILSKGKNSYQTWKCSENNIKQMPEDIFKESIKRANKDISINGMNISFNLFVFSNNTSYDKICEFCQADYASVVYEPCGHQIHCDYCSFMPYKCAECKQDIEGKRREPSGSIVAFDEWSKLSGDVIGEKCPRNMKEWFSFVTDTINYMKCCICNINNWDVVLQCGHTFCKACTQKLKECTHCKNSTEKHILIKCSQLI